MESGRMRFARALVAIGLVIILLAVVGGLILVPWLTGKSFEDTTTALWYLVCCWPVASPPSQAW